jgi:hypothetical protein
MPQKGRNLATFERLFFSLEEPCILDHVVVPKNWILRAFGEMNVKDQRRTIKVISNERIITVEAAEQLGLSRFSIFQFIQEPALINAGISTEVARAERRRNQALARRGKLTDQLNFDQREACV